MTTHEINGHKIIIEDSIDELTIVRDHKFNIFLMNDANAGSDCQDFNRKIDECIRMIDRGDSKDARLTLVSMQYNLTNIVSHLNFKHFAIAAMVIEIDGVKTQDTEQGINDTLEKLKKIGVKRGWINRTIDEIKKKMDSEEDQIFGATLTAQAVEYLTKLKQKTEIILKSILGIEPSDDLVKEIDDFFYILMKPKIFWGAEGFINKYDLAFERTCMVMNQYLPQDIKKMTVKEFKVALIELNKQNKKK